MSSWMLPEEASPLQPSAEALRDAAHWILVLSQSGFFFVLDEDGRRWGLSHVAADGSLRYARRDGREEPQGPRSLQLSRGRQAARAASGPPSPPRVEPDVAASGSLLSLSIGCGAERAAGPRLYRKLSYIGRGSSGRVFKALDDRGGFCAVKEGSDASAEDVWLQREALLLKRAAHACVVPVWDTLRPQGLCAALVMPLASCTLAQRLRGCVGERFLLDCLASVHAALLHVHRVGLVHLDVKPANVLLFGRQAKLGDFGSAQRSGERFDCLYAVTRTYRPPEVLLGCDTAFFAMDAWAFGMLAVQLATQRELPFGACGVTQAQQTLALLGVPGPAELAAALAPHAQLLPEDAPLLRRAAAATTTAALPPRPGGDDLWTRLGRACFSERLLGCARGLLRYDALARRAAFEALRVPGGGQKRKRRASASVAAVTPAAPAAAAAP
jgi:hypothetical protein